MHVFRSRLSEETGLTDGRLDTQRRTRARVVRACVGKRQPGRDSEGPATDTTVGTNSVKSIIALQNGWSYLDADRVYCMETRFRTQIDDQIRQVIIMTRVQFPYRRL